MGRCRDPGKYLPTGRRGRNPGATPPAPVFDGGFEEDADRRAVDRDRAEDLARALVDRAAEEGDGRDAEQEPHPGAEQADPEIGRAHV